MLLLLSKEEEEEESLNGMRAFSDPGQEGRGEEQEGTEERMSKACGTKASE